MKKLAIISILILSVSTLNAQDLEFLIWKGEIQKVINQLEPEFINGKLDDEKSFVLAKAYRSENQIQKALEILNKLTENPKILKEKAECLASLGNNIDAVDILYQIYENEPDNHQNAVKLGKTFLNIKENRKAAEVFEKLSYSDTTNIFYLRNYAIACQRSGQTVKAAELYEKVLKLNKRDLSSILNLASIYQSDSFDKAMSVVAKGRMELKNNLLLEKKYAELAFLKKNYKVSKLLYTKIMHRDSSYNVRKNYAISLYFNREYSKALEHLEELHHLNPGDSFVAFYFGLSLKKLEMFEESEKYIKLAIEIGTPHFLAGFYHHLADNYRKREMYAECIECYKKVLELDATNSEVYLDLATMYEEYNSNNTVALGYYKEYLKNCDDCDEKKVNYASERIKRLKEELFMNE